MIGELSAAANRPDCVAPIIESAASVINVLNETIKSGCNFK
jgi:hypothetical protein